MVLQTEFAQIKGNDLYIDDVKAWRVSASGKSTLTATPCMTCRPTSRMEITLIWQKTT